MNGHRKDQVRYSIWVVIGCMLLAWAAVAAWGISLLFTR